MPESKSGALTNLAIPQNSGLPVPQRVFKQTGACPCIFYNRSVAFMKFSSSSSGYFAVPCLSLISAIQHFTGNFSLCFGCLFYRFVFNEKAVSRARHSGMKPLLSQVVRDCANVVVSCQDDWLQIIAPK